ncbi:hypothetical protein OJAV_G00192570 [Oryzias javanicus]|uniref:Uncharacterized protein n=1 Tax=Oryzias javanicus TaxID=123683 RepID=A0A3S2M4C1_ORYJA|nr:hypothetical protein OJAV_G00192570 [Oryzias javanicus]
MASGCRPLGYTYSPLKRRGFCGARGAWEEEGGLRPPYRCKPNGRWSPRTSSALNYCSPVILHVRFIVKMKPEPRENLELF